MVVTIDKDALQEIAKYDGCYCLKTDVPNEIASKERVHERYKQLIQVEAAFREMKGDILNIRPLYLRKAERTKGHVMVVMLGYMILHKLKELWSSIEGTIEEALDSFNNVCILNVEHNKNSFLKLSNPNIECTNLLNLAKIKWPKFIAKGIIV
jgi:transposase